MVNGQPVMVPFIVTLECFPDTDAGTLTTLQDKTTANASHELVEAVTDPEGFVAPAYTGTDVAYTAWGLAILGLPASLERADMCGLFGSSYFKPAGFPYMVQRAWSNANVMAGKDPCAPYHTGELSYFLAQPVFDQDFAVHEAQSPPSYLPTVHFT